MGDKGSGWSLFDIGQTKHKWDSSGREGDKQSEQEQSFFKEILWLAGAGCKRSTLIVCGWCHQGWASLQGSMVREGDDIGEYRKRKGYLLWLDAIYVSVMMR